MALGGEFAHLHVHSHYSLLDGLGKPRDLLEKAKQLGQEALALTDHGVMYGIVEFVQQAEEVGVKPIVGVEAYLAPNGHEKQRGKIDAKPRHLTLLAQNNDGYKNLVKLTTQAHLEGFYYKPRIDYKILEDLNSGVIVLSGCLNGDIAKAIEEKRLEDAENLIKWHLEVFGRERFYLEVQDHPNIPEQIRLNQALVKYAKKFGVGLVATNDSHYVDPEDAEAQDVLLCVQTGKKVQDQDRMNMLGEDFSLCPTEEVKIAWKEQPEALENTLKIAEMCDVKFEFGVNKLPPYPLPRGKTADDLLRDECEKGLKTRYGNKLPEEAQERLDYELGVIGKTGYASYFLIVADFVNEAKKRGILVGPGRGSAAGSFVSYLMNITNLDPLEYNLLFERFLNPERVSMPDIDLDFADDRREEVIQYVREKYGKEHVAQIITFGTMAARAAVRDAGRALDLPYSFCDAVAKAIPMFHDFEAALQTQDLKDMYESDPQVKKLVDMARKLEGVCRHASTHAAAVVITDEPLTEYLPIQKSSTGSSDNDTVTQYAMYEVEALGLLKIDFLGLKNLTIIKNALDRIEQRYDEKIDIDNLELNDEKAYKLLQAGQTTGVFQLESGGMKRYLKELLPTEFEDIVSMGALYRPGPMDSIPDFIAAKHGRKKITYLHPKLKPILEKTYGVIVTQDQVLEIAREFAGFSYAEADILRKAVGKKIKKLLDEQRQKFISGAIEHSKVTRKTAQAVWDFIEPFARYGFNRAHAACYAMIAYQTAYLKANYPAEFMAALLTSDEGNTDRAAVEVAEAIGMGLEILPPDVNESYENFTVVPGKENDAIRFGLAGVKNVGHGAVSAIIEEREQNGEFKDLTDIFSRVTSRDFNRKSVESLARAGAFDSICDRNLILENIEALLEFNKNLHKQKDAGQQGLFGEDTAPTVKIDLVEANPADKQDKLTWEKELLGMYVSEHPLQDWQAKLQDKTVPLQNIKNLRAQSVVSVAGVVATVKKIVTKSQQSMAFVELEDLAGTAEVVVFPGVYDKSLELWEEGKLVVITGKTNDKDGEIKILADQAYQLSLEILKSLKKTNFNDGAKTKSGSSLTIQLPAGATRDLLEKIKQVLAEAQDADGIAVGLVIPLPDKKLKVDAKIKVKVTPELSSKLAQLVGLNAVSR